MKDDEVTDYRQYLESNTLGIGDMPDPTGTAGHSANSCIL